MQDFVGSVRRSFVFRSSTSGEDDGGGLGCFVEKIGASIRRSQIGLFSKPPAPPALPPVKKTDDPPIRWRKGEMIGSGAFGRVYMGMNLDSGELLAVKQVLIAANASKEKTQAQIRELEEEVKLLQNLSHPNIVRYLGTARENDSFNILLEFVPGGSIQSLLGKFGSFPEPVIRMYTKQLLLGLEYLHKNRIVHRDIKGANILVDNKGCIKLADFGASKKVVELATINGAKSMKGTPYWMAPEVILGAGHRFSADIWSVGCTIIEMATGKPPWSQQYQEVAALFHIGTTKSHPPIPEHLSFEAKDFLLKCLQKESELRPSASDLLQHPFVTGNYQEHAVRSSIMEPENLEMASGFNLKSSRNSGIRSTSIGLKDVCEMGSVSCSTAYLGKFSEPGAYWKENSYDNSMCQIDDGTSVNFSTVLASADLNKSFNPICEPTEDWPCKFDQSSELSQSGVNLSLGETIEAAGIHGMSAKENGFTFLCGLPAADDDEEVTEIKIRTFLDEKALELKKLQSPLYEEFYNTLNGSLPTSAGTANGENILSLPPKSRSPKRLPSRRLSAVADAANIVIPKGHKNHLSITAGVHDRTLQEIQPPIREWKGLNAQQETISPSMSFSERQRRWKEELDQELERKREMLRKTSSPKDKFLFGQREQFRSAFSGK
ncbi:mitogen-activated protein kinase kinase kinase NPK1-like isoform X2 [Hibiscus syriacus]|uniref:mitogen-activated protein kinase kinase kinase NPK1-like isoform X2 n=1 Tax=Hibiscus syriacus TaxID=106335 RepID=UPI0019235074|nr:mitogen-activated protein kinase kinase kinase NPK1-like isoform X2 [Hibiscus syriacus]